MPWFRLPPGRSKAFLKTRRVKLVTEPAGFVKRSMERICKNCIRCRPLLLLTFLFTKRDELEAAQVHSQRLLKTRHSGCCFSSRVSRCTSRHRRDLAFHLPSVGAL